MKTLTDLPRRVLNLWTDTRQSPDLRKPTAIQFPVNDVCNSRCEMCFIWEQKKSRELSPEEIRQILRDPVFDRVTHVGLNGGEPTLRRDLGEIAEAVVESLPRLKAINVITNAIQRNRVIERVGDVGRVASEHGRQFDVMVSIDGVGDIHDQVRGREGNFESALYVIDALSADSHVDSIRVACTLTPTNAKHGEELLEWAVGRGIYARFRVAVPHQRLYNIGRAENFVVHGGHDLFAILMLLDRLIRDYETDPERVHFYASLLRQLAYGEPRTAGCAWRNHGVTLLPDASLAYCAVESPKLGSALKQSAESLYWDNDEVRRTILDTKCDGCTHDYEGPSSFSTTILAHAPGGEFAEKVQSRLALESRGVRELTGWKSSHRPKNQTHRGESLLFTGWYGTETVGDQAILGGLLRIALKTHDGPIVIASLEPFITRRTLQLLGAPPERVSALSYSKCLEMVIDGRVAAVAMAGGPVMSGIKEIREVSQIHRAAATSGVPSGLLGIGVGPIGGGIPKFVVKELIHHADIVAVRDSDSQELAADLGAAAPIKSGDPALIWLAEQSRWNPVPQPNLALALRKWPIHEYGGGQIHEEHRALFETQLGQAIDALSETYDLVPMPMGFVHVGGDDRRFLRSMLGAVDELTSLTGYPTPDSTVRTVNSSSGVISMRFHGVLFALALGSPVVAIDYTVGGKVAALASEFRGLSVLDPRTVNDREIREAVESAKPIDESQVREATFEARTVLESSLKSLVA